jgi:hypothetical protein
MMKKYYKLIMLGCIAVLAYACKKESVENVSFDASVVKTTVKVGDTVIFNFTGNANIIQFWSGEPTHVYANRGRSMAAGAINQFSFSSATANLATGNVGQTNNLKVLVSTDFSGIVDSINIKKASWTDITSRATVAANATTVSSGNVNVSDFQNTGHDSLFVAFKYQSTTSSNASRARQYTLSAFTFQNIFPNGVTYVHNTINTDVRFSGFQAYSFKTIGVKDSIRWAIAGTLAIAQGVDNLSDEDWTISKGFNLGFVPPDVAVGIQNSNVNAITQYAYKYTTPGTYTVTFVAINDYGTEAKQVVKQFTITVN